MLSETVIVCVVPVSVIPPPPPEGLPEGAVPEGCVAASLEEPHVLVGLPDGGAADESVVDCVGVPDGGVPLLSCLLSEISARVILSPLIALTCRSKLYRYSQMYPPRLRCSLQSALQ